MPVIKGNFTAIDWLETVSIKSVEDITADTIALINYYGKSYTDLQKIQMDDYFEGVKAQSYASKIVHSMYPFLAPNMTGAEIVASKPTANKAFYCPFTEKLPDGSSTAQMFASAHAGNHSITDLGITQNTAIPNGSSFSILANLAVGVTDANNYSAGMFTNVNTGNTKVGAWSLYKGVSTQKINLGASTSKTDFTAVNKHSLLMATKSSTSQADTILLNENQTIATDTYVASNFDTTINYFSVFTHNEDNSGKTVSFFFLANRMTPAELQDFYTRTLTFVNAFSIVLP